MKTKFFALLMSLMFVPSALASELQSQDAEESLATAFGKLVGSIAALQEKEMPGFDKNKFVEGFNATLKGDTTESYFMGLQFAMQVIDQTHQLEQQGVKFDMAEFCRAFDQGIKTQDISEEKMKALQMSFQRHAEEAQSAAALTKAGPNKQQGAEYVAKKLKEKGYKKTASGLVYKVISKGKGKQFVDGDVVLTKYVGKHIDGTEFDSSEGEAVPFELNHVIPGFAEAIKLMSPGAKMEIIIPSDLAYGDRGNGPLEPGETLVFELETVGLGDPADVAGEDEEAPDE